MSIKPLPESEVRLLASSLHIVSATTLVKELLDNAIDAKATFIDVIVSPNTVDRIEVRDNGTGIHVDDYDSLGRRGHTSKLRRFEELNGRASKSLGFRGDALASANSVAALTITTRTSTDTVAAVLQLTSKIGGVFDQRPASAPVGTTISIRGLYSGLPVREQVAIKAAPKTLDSIKKLVRSYAAARPQLRLTLKVSKTPKLAWSYAPKPDAGLREAVLQLCGTAVTSQCFGKHATIITNTDNQAADVSFSFEAYVPKPDADQHVLPKFQSVSIDGRPMTTSRGTAKKLLSMIRKFAGNAMEMTGRSRPVKDVFICLNIKCPQGSYDVNIEPSKDDVLFENEAAFMGCFEKFCSGIYGPISTPNMTEPARQGTTPSCSNDLPTRLTYPCFDTHPADGRSLGESKPFDRIENVHADKATVSLGLDTESDQIDHSAPTGSARSRRHKPTTKILSGWTTASALLAQDQEVIHEFPVQKQRRNDDDVYSPGLAECANDMAADLSEKIDEPRRKQGRSRLLPPPTQRELPKEAQYESQAIRSDSGLVSKSKSSSNHQADTLTGVPLTPEPEVLCHFRVAPGDLNPSPLSRPKHSPLRENEQSMVKSPARQMVQNPTASLLQGGFVSQRRTAPIIHHTQPPWTPPSSIQINQEKSGNSYQRPQNPAGSLRQTTISFGSPGGKARQGGSGITHKTMPQDEKQETLSFHGLGPPLGLPEPIPLSRPHQNHLMAGTTGQGQHQSRRVTQSQENHAFSNLCSFYVEDHEGMGGNEPVQTPIPSGDPRAYLLRRQKSVAAGESSGRPRKLRRVKSSLLPMEHVPEHGETHPLLLVITISARDVSRSIEDVEQYDSYITENDLGEGLDMNGGELQRTESRLDALLSLWQEGLTGEKINVASRLTECLKNQETGQTRNK